MWNIFFTSSAKKAYFSLPKKIQAIADLLIGDLKISGPVRGNWKNYGKLMYNEHHCHLKSGRPTYVMCWRVIDNNNKIIEVYYAGTHEKAPY